jgi:HD-GYP domain-containing protein (c-di-GMP phosphodiesterase class II)
MEETPIRDRIEELITRLARAVQITQMYGPQHNLAAESADSLFTWLTDLLDRNKEITIGIIGDEFAFEKQPLYEYSQRKKGFIEYLKAKGVNKISFKTGVEKQEIIQMNKILAAKNRSLDKPETVQAMLLEAGIRNIAIGDIGFIDPNKDMPPKTKKPDEPPEIKVRRDYRKSIQFLTKTFQELKSNQPLNVQNARQIVDGLIKNLLTNKNLLLMMTSIKGLDENMFLHGVNVAVFTLLQAEVLGLEDKYLTDLGMASLLHDIGKLGLPRDAIKSLEAKSGKEMTPEDEKQLAFQDIAGAKILLESEGIPVLAAIAAFEHNMRYDLQGPPRKVFGKSLNLVSMMLAISNQYDLIRRNPEYYKEGGPEKAYDEMMAEAGKRFHPDLLENFFTVIGVFPPGTLVELDTGEIALVIQASMLDKKRPQIEIIYNSDGEKYKEPRIVNLVEKDRRGQYKRSITRSISPTGQFKLPEKYSSEQ